MLKDKINKKDSEYIKLLHDIISEWSELIGKNLIVGQMLDLKQNIEELIDFKITNFDDKKIMIYKTCSLFIFSFLLGAIFSGKDVNLSEYKKMGYYMGLMYQIMDDFKDINTDDPLINYIKKTGKINSLKVYNKSKKELLKLLKKNNILTNDLLYLIEKIDSKIKYNLKEK